jgi:hypothetical protein
MANRFPLVADSSSNQIKEIPSGDNLDLSGNGIVNASSIAISGGTSLQYLMANGTTTTASSGGIGELDAMLFG